MDVRDFTGEKGKGFGLRERRSLGWYLGFFLGNWRGFGFLLSWESLKLGLMGGGVLF